jgi:UDP-N-acetylmuramate--alanine ligase
VLSNGGLDPTVVIGGRLKEIGSNAKLGLGEFFVAEADESDGSFLKLAPTIAVVTNIDREHMEFFGIMARLKGAFLEFINKVPFYGLAILCADNSYVQELLPKVHRRFVTYGINETANFRAGNITYSGLHTSFEVLHDGESLGVFELQLPGLHNVTNGLAAIAAALELDIPLEVVRQSFKSFQGIQRRFEFKGQADGIWFYDDYGHHPTEIKAALAAAKTVNGVSNGRLVVLFQPHRYTRTKDLLTEFYHAFQWVDKLILMDIYAASETPIHGIDSGLLLDGIRACGCNAVYIQDKNDVLNYLDGFLEPGDLFLTLGAGDVWKLGMEVLMRKNTPN